MPRSRKVNPTTDNVITVIFRKLFRDLASIFFKADHCKP